VLNDTNGNAKLGCLLNQNDNGIDTYRPSIDGVFIFSFVLDK